MNSELYNLKIIYLFKINKLWIMSFEMTSKMSNTKITFLGKNDFHIIQSQNHSYQNTFSNFTI